MVDCQPFVRVLGFDGWTMGSHHYVRLLDTFRKLGIELILVHLGSWGDDPGRPVEERLGRLLTRDISYYMDRRFHRILDIEKPDVVLFLSTETFAHRAFQRYCRKKNIPTIHLYHGLFGVVPTTNHREAYRVNVLAQMQFVIRQSRKFLLHAMPAYARSLWDTSASCREWGRFAKDIVSRILGKTIFVAATDAKPTKVCVFTPADFQDAYVRFGCAREDVVAVGNPDLLHFKITRDALGAFAERPVSGATDVMYIDSGISSHGYAFSSDEDYLSYIVSCREQFAGVGLNLVFKVKPHPAHRRDYLSQALSQQGVPVIGNGDFVEQLKSCCVCITEPSTLGLIPALLGMPLLLNKVGALATLPYGEVFTSYPRSRELREWHEIRAVLDRERSALDVQEVRSWIGENSGPLPAEDMPKRVAEVVLDLARRRQTVEGPNTIAPADGGSCVL